MSEIQLDPQRQARAREYARLHRRLMVVDLILGGLYCLVWLVTGWSVQLREWLSGWTMDPYLLVAGFSVVFGGIYVLINLPMSYYSGFVLPHRYELSTQTLQAWVVDQLKGACSAVFLDWWCWRLSMQCYGQRPRPGGCGQP